MSYEPEFLRPTLAVDEIGIAYGVFGRYRLRTLLQPVRQAGEGECALTHLWLRPGFFLGRDRVARAAISAEAGDADRARLGEIGFAIDMANGVNAGVPGTGLLLTADPEPDEASTLDARRWFECSGAVPPGSIVQIARAGERQPDALSGLAAAIRAAGMGVAVDVAGLGGPDMAVTRSMAPELITFPARAVREAARVRHGAGLMLPLVSACRELGTTVLFGGIDGAAELELALSCGADLVRGEVFDAWCRAGADFEAGPVRPDVAQRMARAAS